MSFTSKESIERAGTGGPVRTELWKKPEHAEALCGSWKAYYRINELFKLDSQRKIIFRHWAKLSDGTHEWRTVSGKVTRKNFLFFQIDHERVTWPLHYGDIDVDSIKHVGSSGSGGSANSFHADDENG